MALLAFALGLCLEVAQCCLLRHHAHIYVSDKPRAVEAKVVDHISEAEGGRERAREGEGDAAYF